jgi:transcriptional regulator with XRE-family HTH domain
MVLVAAGLLRETRLAAGLSTRSLARRAGTPPARVSEVERAVHDPSVGTLDRLLRSARCQLAVLPTRAPTAATVALAIRDSLSDGPHGEERSFRALVALSDGLGDAALDVRVALCVSPAPPTGDRRFDAAIAAVVDHHLSRSRLPLPAWVQEPTRSLPDPWVPDPYAGDGIAAETPEAFLRHGVLLAERELAST